MTSMRIGIASYEEMKARTMAIARGEYHPEPDEPKVWFTSIESVAKVLSDGNHDLVKIGKPCHM
jgi:predicted transcriptional regulator